MTRDEFLSGFTQRGGHLAQALEREADAKVNVLVDASAYLAAQTVTMAAFIELGSYIVDAIEQLSFRSSDESEPLGGGARQVGGREPKTINSESRL